MFDIGAFERDGFVRLSGFVDASTAAGLLEAAITLARRDSMGEAIAPAFVTPEANLADTRSRSPEDAVSKIFRLHRIEPFRGFVSDSHLVDHVSAALGTDDLDCFGSQFIFKNPGDRKSVV